MNAIRILICPGLLAAAFAGAVPGVDVALSAQQAVPSSAAILPGTKLPDSLEFGTVTYTCSLPLGSAYAGYGLTWRREEGRFYILGQDYTGAPRAWKFDPEDPRGSVEPAPWQFANLGDTTRDIPWGICWDEDSACFWVSHILDRSIFSGCVLARYTWQDSCWAWQGDSWQVGDSTETVGLQCLWSAGMEKWPGTGVFYGVPVHRPSSPLNHVARFDPYTKTYLGRLAQGDSMSERGCALLPWDSCYVMTCNWGSSAMRKRDSTGVQLDRADSEMPADWAVYHPRVIAPTDTVFLYCIQSGARSILQKVVVGMRWGDLPSSGVGLAEKPTKAPAPGLLAARPNPFSGRTELRFDLPRATGALVEVYSSDGRLVRVLAPGRHAVTWDGTDASGRSAGSGVYYARLIAGDFTGVTKLVLR